MGDNTACGAVMVQPIRFQCAAVWISIGLTFTDIYTSLYVYSMRTFEKSYLRRTFLNIVIAYVGRGQGGGGGSCTIHPCRYGQMFAERKVAISI